jgi:hypothetical protein
MGLLAKLFRAVPQEEMGGIHLDGTRPFWEVSGQTDFPSLLLALPDLLPMNCILYFEGGSPCGELLGFLHEHTVPEGAHVAYGTIWPKPRVFHIPATPETINRLSKLIESCAEPELAIHFHVYRDRTVLLEWHDAFSQPMLVSGDLPEQKVRIFAARLGMALEPGSVEPSDAPNDGPAASGDNSDASGGGRHW